MLEKNLDLTSEQSVVSSLQATFEELENNFEKLVQENYRLGFGSLANVGSCALLSLVIKNKLYVANLGDSKGVLISDSAGGASLKDLNSQLNANSAEEQARLSAKFPNEKDIFVCRSQKDSCYVKGRLQPTYAFGDLHLKSALYNNPMNRDRKA